MFRFAPQIVPRFLQSVPAAPTSVPTPAPTNVFGQQGDTDYLYIAVSVGFVVLFTVLIMVFCCTQKEKEAAPEPERRRKEPSFFTAAGSGTDGSEGAPLLNGGPWDELKKKLTIAKKKKGMHVKILQKNAKNAGTTDTIDALLSIDDGKRDIGWVKNAMVFSGTRVAFSLEKLERVQIGKFSELMKKVPVKETLCLSLVFESSEPNNVLDLVFEKDNERNEAAFGFQQLIDKLKKGEQVFSSSV